MLQYIGQTRKEYDMTERLNNNKTGAGQMEIIPREEEGKGKLKSYGREIGHCCCRDPRAGDEEDNDYVYDNHHDG